MIPAEQAVELPEEEVEAALGAASTAQTHMSYEATRPVPPRSPPE